MNSFLILVVCCAIGACTSVSDGSQRSPRQSTGSGAPASPSDDVPRHDLLDEQVIEWTALEQLDDRTLRVRYVTGDLGCTGTRAVVRETETAVSIAVIEGVLPEAKPYCTAVAREGSLLVTLDAPVGGRPIEQLTFSGEIPDD